MPQNVNLTIPNNEKIVRLVKMSLNPCPCWSADAPPVSTMFSLKGGRYSTPMPKSSTKEWRIGDWNNRNSIGSVRINRKYLKLAKPRNFGVMSKSIPELAIKIPGFTKFDCASSLLDRKLGIKLPGVVSKM